MTRGTDRPASESTWESPVLRDVVILTFDSAQILDVTGPLEVFSSATRLLPAAHYRTQVVTTAGGQVRSSSGLEFASRPIAEVGGPVDTLVVAGGDDMDAAVGDSGLLNEIRRLASDARRVTSVCSGAFLLAAAGLLHGRRATTHWAECAQLEARCADVTVDPDAIFVHDGNVWTSAGVTAGIDLALALVADDHGRQAAATVARQLVVYLQRSGGQAQYSTSWPDKLRTPNQCVTCCPGCGTTSPKTSPWPHWLGMSACRNDSSPEYSKLRSASPRQSTSKPSASSPLADSWRPPTETSNRSPRPAASEHPRP